MPVLKVAVELPVRVTRPPAATAVIPMPGVLVTASANANASWFGVVVELKATRRAPAFTSELSLSNSKTRSVPKPLSMVTVSPSRKFGPVKTTSGANKSSSSKYTTN